jgi:hypothetical protein
MFEKYASYFRPVYAAQMGDGSLILGFMKIIIWK